MNKIKEFQKLVRENLQEDKDYGTIPGTSKPTLYKPGAEKILMLMGLQSTYEILDSTRNWEKEGFFQYQVRCTLKKGDIIITQGLGCCNSKENKYLKQNAFNVDNTILKMAKKRSQVDATLTVASLSEIFTQDLEDEELNGTNKKSNPATPKQINYIKEKMIGSSKATLKEKQEWEKLIAEGISFDKAYEKLSWWMGNSKKGIIGEGKKREEAEKKAKDNLKEETNLNPEKIKITKDDFTTLETMAIDAQLETWGDIILEGCKIPYKDAHIFKQGMGEEEAKKELTANPEKYLILINYLKKKNK
jgi:hypothetical protein